MVVQGELWSKSEAREENARNSGPPGQRPYSLEIQCEVPVQQTAEVSSSQNPDPVSTEVRTKQPVSTRSCARRAAAVEADRGRKTWLEDLT